MRSNTEWIHWGKYDPLWAVAGHPGREKHGANPWNDADFYKIGQADWEVFSRRWSRFGMDTQACLEIGCGAGRMTKWLARTFAHVHAVDVSPEQVEYARGHVDEPNITFHVTDAQRLPVPDASVTGVFSTHVFQHFESVEESVPVFREISRVLRPGGSIMIHLPLYTYPHPGSRITRLARRLYSARRSLADAVAAWRRSKLKRGKHVVLMRGTYYEVDWLYRTLLDLGMDEVEFSFIAPEPKTPLNPFAFARKGGA